MTTKNTFPNNSKSTSVSHLLRHLTTCACLIIASINTNALAQYLEPGTIAPFEVVYEVSNNLINAGTAKLSLTTDDELWTYQLSTKPRGIIKLAGKGELTETSTMKFVEIDDKVLIQSQVYSYRQDDERRRSVDATFDWDDNSVTHLYRSEAETTSFETPVFDRLAATVFMMNAVRVDFTTIELPVFDTNRIKVVEFINEGVDIVETPLGKFETIRVVNRNSGGGTRETTTWFAPTVDFTPVKIEHRKRGKLVARMEVLSLDERLTNIRLSPPSPSEQVMNDEF